MKVFYSRLASLGCIFSVALICTFCSGKTGYVDTIVLESFDDEGNDMVIQKGEKIWLANPKDSMHYEFLVDMHSLEPVRLTDLKTWPIIEVDPYLIKGSDYLRVRDTDYVMNLFDDEAIRSMIHSTFYERFIMDKRSRLWDRLFGDAIKNIGNKDFKLPKYELTEEEEWLMKYQPFFTGRSYEDIEDEISEPGFMTPQGPDEAVPGQ